MKKIIILISFVMIGKMHFAQTQEVQQLLLNWEKLAQFKQMLADMKSGYEILYKGYTTIKDISEGNFSLHKTFLDGLMEVSPAVRNYKRIADIISYQLKIVKECKSAISQLKASKQFTQAEIEYISNVYANSLNRSLHNLDELAMVITAGKLRMSDDERLQAIDRVYISITDQYAFLQSFNNQAAVLAVQREKEQMEVNLSKKIQGLE